MLQAALKNKYENDYSVTCKAEGFAPLFLFYQLYWGEVPNKMDLRLYTSEVARAELEGIHPFKPALLHGASLSKPGSEQKLYVQIFQKYS